MGGLTERRITDCLPCLCHHQPRYFSEVKYGLCSAMVNIQSVPNVLVEIKILRLPKAMEVLLTTQPIQGSHLRKHLRTRGHCLSRSVASQSHRKDATASNKRILHLLHFQGTL